MIVFHFFCPGPGSGWAVRSSGIGWSAWDCWTPRTAWRKRFPWPSWTFCESQRNTRTFNVLMRKIHQHLWWKSDRGIRVSHKLLILDPPREQNHVCVWVQYGTLSAVKEVYCRDRFLLGGCEIPQESPLSMEELLRRGNVSEGDRQRRSAQY